MQSVTYSKNFQNSERIIFANGCSMCYGSELFDDVITRQCYDNQQRFANSWPGVLGRELAVNRVVNLGYPGGANDRILRTTIAWILENWQAMQSANASLLVVIGWTNPMRREFYINGTWRQLIPYQDYTDPSASLLNRVYRETAWTEYESAIRYATQLISLQSFLQARNIPYVFFDAIISFAQINKDADNGLDNYKPHINKHNYLHFDDIHGDMGTQLINGKSEGRHPNMAGHVLWASLLRKHILSHQIFLETQQSVPKESSTLIYEGVTSVDVLTRKANAVAQPSSNYNFKRTSPDVTEELEAKSKSLFSRIRKAIRRDPFIYD